MSYKNEESKKEEVPLIFSKNDSFNPQYLTIEKNLQTNKAQVSKINEEDYTGHPSFEITENTPIYDIYKGLLFMFLSCIFRTIFSFLCKWSLKYNKDLHPYHQVTFFNYYYFIFTLITLCFNEVKVFSEEFLHRKHIILMIIRNLLALSSIILLNVSLKYMNMSDVFSVFYLYPAFVIIMSVIFLNEKAWWFDYVCCLACFIGAVLIVRPEFIFHDKQTSSNGIFFLLVIISAIIKAIEDVATRFMGNEMHYQAINLFYSTLGMLIFPSLIVLYLKDQIPSTTLFEQFIFLCTGVCSWIYHTFSTMAFQCENAGRVSMINYLQVDFMYILDIFIFDKSVVISDLVGTLMIFSFNFCNGLYKTIGRIASIKKEIERKKKLKENELNAHKDSPNFESHCHENNKKNSSFKGM
jgi:drug/metabolite transporter (DMT)-like permease